MIEPTPSDSLQNEVSLYSDTKQSRMTESESVTPSPMNSTEQTPGTRGPDSPQTLLMVPMTPTQSGMETSLFLFPGMIQSTSRDDQLVPTIDDPLSRDPIIEDDDED